MNSTPAANSRPVEPRLAARFHQLLQSNPPQADRPVTEHRVMAILADAIQWKASDLHIEPGSQDTRIRMRVDGLLHDVAALPNFSGHRLISFFKVLAEIDATALARPEHGHGRIEVAGTMLELRITAVPTPVGEMISIRMRDTLRPMLRVDDIGMTAADQAHLRDWLKQRRGMLLVCGPAGAGKTSTLYSLLHELQRLPRSTVTVEDPVECHLEGITQIEVNTKRGLTFPEAIRAMLRLDPDFLLVGEIRDPESAHVAITAAGSGQAMLSTIHARDAAGAVTALRNNGLKNWEISAALEVGVSQRLVRRLCTRCRVPAELTREDQQWFASTRATVPQTMWQAKGCDQCAGTGFEGRVGLFEVWRVTSATRHLILNGADEPTLTRQAMEGGMQPLLIDAIGKLASGITSLSEIRFLHSQNMMGTFDPV